MKSWLYTQLQSIDLAVQPTLIGNFSIPSFSLKGKGIDLNPFDKTRADYIDSVKTIYKFDIKDYFDYPLLMNTPSYSRYVVNELNTYFADICNLKLNTIRVYIQIQRPGMITPLHVDINKQSFWSEKKLPTTRYLMFLDDIKLGQAFQVNSTFLQWKKGDLYHIPEDQVAHGGANFGFEDRPIVQITGEVNK